jgi:hypothetical protein
MRDPLLIALRTVDDPADIGALSVGYERVARYFVRKHRRRNAIAIATMITNDSARATPLQHAPQITDIAHRFRKARIYNPSLKKNAGGETARYRALGSSQA